MTTVQWKTILIDPPWPETGGGLIKRGADRHYPVVKVRDMPGVILESGVFAPATNAHLYLWATNNYLPDALWLIEQLRFRYITPITWAKTGRIGLGQYFRGQTEHLLFAVWGDGLKLRRSWTDARNLSTLVSAPRPTRDGKIIHSAKPDEIYKLIEVASPPPRLEMFARRRRRGWTGWGNEV